ncbi:MAG: hypothetical protein KAV41_03290 [Candidatus Pacebacteria bacterium]|nr:hypothetical protein [Candidatus Paceibacterota bacterium]
MYFTREFIWLIKETLSIEEIIQNEGVELFKRGSNYFVALCPFHQEKHASFVVITHKQFWHCFGCGAGGDCFDFIRQIRGINFPLSVKYVATRYGIQLSDDYNKKRQSQRNKDRLTFNAGNIDTSIKNDTIIF